MVRKSLKILIIKLGYSETLVPQIRPECSLGDVLRTTAVLHLFKNDHVTWLTDEAALPLLQDNPYIDRLLSFNLLSVLQLEGERFDKVINLEKVPGVCALVNRINAWSHYGFRFDEETGRAEAYERAHEALAVATREEVKKLNDKPWIDVLFNVLGAKWKGESYVLGRKPATQVQYDLGFNTHVGDLLPLKAWPAEHWRELEKLAEGKYTVTHQQHLNNLEGYMDWINTCRLLITNDSLGLYLGVALGKKVLGLFGPTPISDQSAHERLKMLRARADCEHMPCCKPVCALDDPCMNRILPQMVLDAIDEWGVE
jgi:heptosyltransferase-2